MNQDTLKENPRTDRMTTIEILKIDKEWLEDNVKFEGQNNHQMLHNLIEIMKKYRINARKRILERITEGS